MLDIKDFFDKEYIQFSTYDNVRKISSYLDGLKNSGRKIVFTLQEQNCESFTKVANLGPRVQDFSQYLHGSLEGSIVNMTQNYVGSGNNIPFLDGDGNFGSRFIPQSAASRYIFAKTSKQLDSIFKKEDRVLLEQQDFEGQKIEPKFYMPTIPTVLANGSEGMSIGFAQKILPRKPSELRKWVIQKASGKRLTADLTPYWNDQDFTVEQGENPLQWIIKGKVEITTNTKSTITALPVGYTLKQYQKVLDELVERKYIRDYEDLSDEDVYRFEISHVRDFWTQNEETILTKLKLVKKVTENLTCVDEQNKIVQFDSVSQLLTKWWEKRLHYNMLRKNFLLTQLDKELEEADAKRIFIKAVIEEKIELRNKKEEDVVKQGEKHNKALVGRMQKLIQLPMRALTAEEVDKLSKRINKIEQDKVELEHTTHEQISINDCEKLEV